MINENKLIDEKIMVSVYCLAYNHEKYIRDTLEGFVSQKTSFCYEVFVHDDASTDRTACIIKEYADNYPHIIKPIFQKENQYSKGIRILTTYIFPKMTGKYVAICEGDDYWCCSDKLQRQVDILEADEGLSACVHQTEELNCKDGTQKKVCDYDEDCIVKLEDVIQRGNGVYQISSLMYRRSYLNDLPTFCTSMKHVGDYPLSIYLSLIGNVYYINELMSVYRLFSSSESWTSNNLGKRNSMRWVENCKAAINMLKQADEFSEFKYHKQFMSVILKYELDIERITKSRWIIFKRKYKDIRKEMQGIYYLKWVVGYILPESMVCQMRKVKNFILAKGNYEK